MLTAPLPLKETADRLRRGDLDLLTFIRQLCDRIDAHEPAVQALLPEENRRERLLQEAAELLARYPDPAHRPLLFGIPVGIKDVFRVDGFPTRAGSKLDPALFAGPEAACVKLLRRAGALILGKTVTTEFAYFEPGPTRNPHNLEHTPGGSSSGSAAAVAAGFCPLALGTQTIGSVIRPAAFCGLVGFKPSYGRIPTEGLLPFSPSADHVGFFTQDAAGALLAAKVLIPDWQEPEADAARRRPVIGLPEGPYAAQAGDKALQVYEEQLRRLIATGYRVKALPVLENIAEINETHRLLIAAEKARVHEKWFAEYAHLYRPRTAELIRQGQAIGEEVLAEARRKQMALRQQMVETMRQAGIDLWAAPAAPGPAPAGLGATGDPVMNLPWTFAGLPALTVPAGTVDGLPVGLQLVASFGADELLLAWSEEIADMGVRS